MLVHLWWLQRLDSQYHQERQLWQKLLMQNSLFIELNHLYISCHFFFLASCLPLVPTLLKGAVRSERGKMKQMFFSLSVSQWGSPVEMPGVPCCFLHQQMADGCIPCVCFSFSKLRVTSGLASAWSEQMGVHILDSWLASKIRRKDTKKRRKQK